MSAERRAAPQQRAARALAGLVLALALGPAAAAVEPALGESVELVRSLRLLPVGEGLETTVFRPDGAGPFPVAVVNHGKAAGDNHRQPRYRLFVNFAGGLRGRDTGCDWRQGMVQAFRRYGAATRGPSLWFYGASDSFFPPALAGAAHAAYRDAGGAAQLVAYELPGCDAHGLLNHAESVSIWLPPLLQALAAARLPVDVVLPQYAGAGRAAAPADAP